MDKSTKILFDVFITDPISVNKVIYRSWLDGISEKETINLREESKNPNIPKHLILEETEDQYRIFSLLQKALEHPKTLSSHSMFQMDPSSRKLLIEGFYDFDEDLLRELIGRKLTSGQRRDLDDTSEKLKLRLSSCERQFDNLKRISRVVYADLKTSALEIIMNEFSLPRELSKKYVRLLFLCFHRIDLSKKKIQFLTTFDLIRLSEIVMNQWGDPIRTYALELDLKLKEDVRDLKTYLGSQKEISEKYWKLIKNRYQIASTSPRITPVTNSSSSIGGAPSLSNTPSLSSMNNSSNFVPILSTTTPNSSNTPTSTIPQSYSSSNISAMNQQQPQTIFQTNQSSTPIITSTSSGIISTSTLSPEKLKNLEGKFKSILKGFLVIGSNLSDSKEFRNLFEDIVEKVIEPLKRIDLAIYEVDTFFVFLREVFSPEHLGITSLRHRDRVVHNWKSFLEGIRCVVIYILSLNKLP
ncbi:hypothetical protein DICPUDRAFT_30238 [Dictyostelium purpureum]|uniref:Uncharacterized protein n=1 Tax=Dictyostelium purpureum TaxID=5786 RepID=F0ZF12_DICPU|nr:uncharacterized protein DICPUDRAFT_30238 [Dictyostelium purpureum]EGC37439.1 hypothetical protein DICPUDRAFT_30238 [Dictyostelium purpureum]|eukprot:XP_003286003.1 hypothetical protein DICPUDRAFT_30238 [Dictyostelium purpureum]